MKYLIVFFACLILNFSAEAQHCPFDGMTMICLKLKKGDLKKDLNFYLREINAPEERNCTGGNDPLDQQFFTLEELRKENEYFRKHEGYLRMDLAKKGDLFICFPRYSIKCEWTIGADDYHSIERTLSIDVMQNSTIIKRIAVNRDRIYSLCTAQHLAKDIKPQIIQL